MGKYKVFCTVDNQWEHFETDTPTETCPTNGAHSVRAGSLTKLKSASEGKKPPALSADPLYPTDGEIWYRTDINEFRFCQNGTIKTLTEGVEVDSQVAGSDTEVTTSSSTFVVMPDMILTTSNTSNKDYLIAITAEVQASNSNRTISIEVFEGGVAHPNTLRNIKITSSGSPQLISTNCLIQNVGNGVDIEVRWKIDMGTATAKGRVMTIYGIS